MSPQAKRGSILPTTEVIKTRSSGPFRFVSGDLCSIKMSLLIRAGYVFLLGSRNLPWGLHGKALGAKADVGWVLK